VLNRLLNGFEGKLTSSKWALIRKTSQDTASRGIDDLLKRGALRDWWRVQHELFARVAGVMHDWETSDRGVHGYRLLRVLGAARPPERLEPGDANWALRTD
jgi:hypothetical protein